MFSSTHSTAGIDVTSMQHAIRHDIDDIDDLDEFLEGDVEDCLQTMLGNAGCFY